ncbi:GGDEF domain-containing protein, partial [Shewanella sp.]|uniref:GGDEF domain-containing protein n=1 Tax=Shewanella sp. TaxID=50422 RepID=UPI00258E18CB
RIAQRNKEPVTIAMLDVDFFKQYNDTYGHADGDIVLTGIAEVFSDMLARANDFVFRVGGEEFVIIFNSKDVASSKEYIDKIRQAVRDLEIVHEKSTVDSCITISIGCVFFDGKGATDGQLLLSDADANLYRAKEKRNHSVQTVLGKPVVVDIEEAKA